jgi:hypothetical protein
MEDVTIETFKNKRSGIRDDCAYDAACGDTASLAAYNQAGFIIIENTGENPVFFLKNFKRLTRQIK